MTSLTEWGHVASFANTIILFLLGIIGWFIKGDVKEMKDRLWRLEQRIFNREHNGRKED